jgi:hypothetical protein
MTIQPIDLASLLRAALWPAIVGLGLVIFRRQLPDLVGVLSRRINKFSFAGVSLELAVVPEMRPTALEIEVRQLNAAPQIQSGVESISGVFGELQRSAERAYIIIDLGSEAVPRWLTSRLYLLSFLITLLDWPINLVFLETTGELRKQFVGIASANSVRWALARRYSWFEAAMAAAYAAISGGGIQFDPASGHLPSWQATQLLQLFLSNIRITQPAPPAAPADPGEWLPLNDGMLEHARWLDGGRIERLLGQDLNKSRVVLMPNQSLPALGKFILDQPGPFVAVLDSQRTFHSLVDRSATLEALARAVLKQRPDENAAVSP